MYCVKFTVNIIELQRDFHFSDPVMVPTHILNLLPWVTPQPHHMATLGQHPRWE